MSAHKTVRCKTHPMQNVDKWQPTKYEFLRGRLCASRDPQQVNVSSRLITDLVGNWYGEMLPVHCRGDVLDLGCGQAPFYHAYRDYSTSITCVDWGTSPHNVRHADHLCDLNEPIPLPEASFDTVIFSDVMEHLYKPHQVFGEIHRLLRPGGKLLMNVPFMYWLHEQPYDFYRYTRFALERMATESNFNVVELREEGGAPEVLTDLLAKLVVRAKIIGPPLAKISQSLCSWWIGTKLGRRMSRATARQFPLGYFLIAEAKP
jgi:SAM-dependent methyltransferase